MASPARGIARPRYSREARIRTKGVRAVVGSRDVEARLRRPINESGLQYRFIPLHRRDSRMMQPASKTAHLEGLILCAALNHVSPGTQSHRVSQAQAGCFLRWLKFVSQSDNLHGVP